MKAREPKYKQKSSDPDRYWVRKGVFDRFGADIVGLANLTERKKTFEGLAAILDLKDFTRFCDQRDSHNAVPEFISEFLEWLFEAIRNESLDIDNEEENVSGEVVLWFHLPIFGKFLGDGLLLLWDVTDMSKEARRNVVQALDLICVDYKRVFRKRIRGRFSTPPSKLRCGIAQGLVTSIAGGKDYVGMCINIASRLQKLAEDSFSFGFSRKGMEETKGQDWYDDFRLIKYKIRGVSKPELIYVLKREFVRLSREDQRTYRV
jgi:class 3 adenylate cyclase